MIKKITYLTLLFFCLSINAFAENTFFQRELLLSHQFSALEKNLTTANNDYLNNKISLHNYYAVIRTFWLDRDLEDLALFDALSNWLETSPQSAYAHVLMGIYWSDKAHQARGGKVAKVTPDKQFVSMDEYFAKSWRLLQQGLKIDPSILHAYTAQLAITRTSSRYGTPQEYMRNVPASMKHNTEIWNTLLQMSTPRWGSSYLRMKKIIEDEVPVYLPKLSDAEIFRFKDAISYDRIDTFFRANKYEKALNLAEKRISNGSEYTAIYITAARTARKLKAPRKCLDFTRKAIQLRPWRGDAWFVRGMCAIDRQLWQQANEAFRHAVFINGLTKYSLLKLGQTYMYLSQFDKAYALFKKAVELDPAFTKYTDMYTSYIEKEKVDQMGLEGVDIYQIIGEF